MARRSGQILRVTHDDCHSTHETPGITRGDPSLLATCIYLRYVRIVIGMLALNTTYRCYLLGVGARTRACSIGGGSRIYDATFMWITSMGASHRIRRSRRPTLGKLHAINDMNGALATQIMIAAVLGTLRAQTWTRHRPSLLSLTPPLFDQLHEHPNVGGTKQTAYGLYRPYASELH